MAASASRADRPRGRNSAPAADRVARAAEVFIRQSWRSQYCGAYATAMLLSLLGQTTDRSQAKGLFCIRISLENVWTPCRQGHVVVVMPTNDEVGSLRTQLIVNGQIVRDIQVSEGNDDVCPLRTQVGGCCFCSRQRVREQVARMIGLEGEAEHAQAHGTDLQDQ